MSNGLESGKSQVTVLANSVPGKSSQPSLWTDASLLYPHMAEKSDGSW